MQARIYRFEILRALANAVFEARDTSSDTLVTIYEWIPPLQDRDPAKRRLAEIQEELHVEVFSADASLYMCAPSTAQAGEVLEVLQEHGLFTGVWFNDAPASPPPPPAPPLPPPIAPDPGFVTRAARPEPQPRKGHWGRTILACLVCGALALWTGETAGKSSAADAHAAEMNRVISRADSAEDRLRQMEAHASESDGKASQTGEELKKFDGVHVLRVANRTPQAARVAVLYQSWTGEWVVHGWKSIAPGAVEIVATSPRATFYYYAYDDTGSWSGDRETDVLLRSNFVYSASTGLTDSDKVSVKFQNVPEGIWSLRP